MPTILDILAATPRCCQRRMIRYNAASQPDPAGQRGVHFTCYEPLRYERDGNKWRCAGCHDVTAALEVVARWRQWVTAIP